MWGWDTVLELEVAIEVKIGGLSPLRFTHD